MISRLKRGLDRGEHPWLKDAALNRLQRAEEQQENAWLPSPERNGKRQVTSSCPAYFSEENQIGMREMSDRIERGGGGDIGRRMNKRPL